jgi:hypothetical protein
MKKGSPDLGYHLKTGHQLSLQNRPTNHTQDQMMFYRVSRHLGKYFLSLNASSREPQGDRARGISAAAL